MNTYNMLPVPNSESFPVPGNQSSYSQMSSERGCEKSPPKRIVCIASMKLILSFGDWMGPPKMNECPLLTDI